MQERLIRPLIDVTRGEVEACCRSLGLRPRLDPTNDDVSLLRNALKVCMSFTVNASRDSAPLMFVVSGGRYSKMQRL